MLSNIYTWRHPKRNVSPHSASSPFHPCHAALATDRRVPTPRVTPPIVELLRLDSKRHTVRTGRSEDAASANTYVDKAHKLLEFVVEASPFADGTHFTEAANHILAGD
jgi:hypothetical protein